MSPALSSRRHDPRVGDEPGSSGSTGAIVRIRSKAQRRPAASGGDRPAGAEVGTRRRRHERRRPRVRAPTVWRLGLVDYALVALTALGVAITLVMAIVNP
jgi:hypothetical protein